MWLERCFFKQVVTRKMFVTYVWYQHVTFGLFHIKLYKIWIHIYSSEIKNNLTKEAVCKDTYVPTTH